MHRYTFIDNQWQFGLTILQDSCSSTITDKKIIIARCSLRTLISL
ncbi:BnaC07g34530D [Brassica napus]|uniref:BnaC07g34530D protein n=1 Tax=Brassica napus TaxID=3708 RepID=A0A078FC79_BRANA|nr:BnaC07g34530D [Brassica napus]